MKEHTIARQIVLGYIKRKESFKLSDVEKTILDNGGIMRVSIGVTVKDYLDNFDKHKIINWSVIENDIQYTVL